jgi:FkbM family methyltransferase
MSPPTEPLRVRAIRLGLQRWPFRRGRGVVLRSARFLLPREPFLTEVEPGILIPGDLDDYMVLHYFVHGLDQDPAFQLARRLVRPGDTVIDVGANIGLWVMGMARAVGARGHVHAFEPFPANFARLRANLERNGLAWVRCHQLAAADWVGDAQFLAPTGSNSGVGALRPDAPRGPFSVRVTTLDEFCGQQALTHVSMLKVDVEGAELRVFQGAQKLLGSADAPMVMFEVGDSLAAAYGSTPTEAKAFLAGIGYEIYRCRAGRLEPVGLEDAHPGSEDLLAVRPAHFTGHPALQSLLRARD